MGAARGPSHHAAAQRHRTQAQGIHRRARTAAAGRVDGHGREPRPDSACRPVGSPTETLLMRPGQGPLASTAARDKAARMRKASRRLVLFGAGLLAALGVGLWLQAGPVAPAA